MIRQIAILFLALLPTVALSGCYYEWCGEHSRDPLDDATNYRWLINGKRYFEPINAWVRHEELEALLLKAYREGGLQSLTSRYGLECTPRLLTPPCDTCFTCRRTIPKTRAEQEPRFGQCQVGEMSFQADVGPGWTMTAMTFWKRPPVETRSRAVAK